MPTTMTRTSTIALVASALLTLTACESSEPTTFLMLPEPELSSRPYQDPPPPPRHAWPRVESVVRTATLTPEVPAAWKPTFRSRPWKHIVIHHSATEAGSAESFARTHNQRFENGLGYHFVITNGDGGPDGQVQVGPRWRKQIQGAHTGGTPQNEYNERGVGIGVVGTCNDCLPTKAQLASLEKLCRFLMREYDIPAGNVIGHRDAPGTATDCPGDRFHRYIHSTLFRKLSGRHAAAK